MLTKIPMTQITLLFSEAPDFIPQSFTRWSAAHQALLQISTTMPSTHGAYKTDFRITFADGFLYHGRIDITPERYNLAQHIQGFCAFYAGTRQPAHLSEDQYHHFLESLHSTHPHLSLKYQQILETYAFTDRAPAAVPLAI